MRPLTRQLLYNGDDCLQLQFCGISIAHLHGDAAERRAVRRHVEEHNCTSGEHASCQQDTARYGTADVYCNRSESVPVTARRIMIWRPVDMLQSYTVTA